MTDVFAMEAQTRNPNLPDGKHTAKVLGDFMCKLIAFYWRDISSTVKNLVACA